MKQKPKKKFCLSLPSMSKQLIEYTQTPNLMVDIATMDINSQFKELKSIMILTVLIQLIDTTISLGKMNL